ncbi:polysaccharide lyase family 7 protein [Uliginosibacterium sp. 31-16]|uniref:polysaccharide lyase family 7 protein n=1 Tax=Uliginosibacterium sp. 31-16 TaxID=3068315 RepID=UPI00273FFD97|nr:polysaccharide lyase family 7 protein [Uliginosibacterium sp. 31-16]MDP5238888.1 polysaccharide lyase family 7 protein [Uliginosibacterium sp. 31-16]
MRRCGLGILLLGCAAPVFAQNAPLSASGLSRWKLSLPVDANGDGKADEVANLRGYANPPWFHATPEGLIFRAHAGGARTSGSTAYARSELREMTAAGRPAAWDCLQDTRSLSLEQTLLATTTAKPEVTLGQIHDARSDNLMLKYSGPADANGRTDSGRIELLWNDAAQREVLDAAYTLGQPMRVTIAADHGTVRVAYRNLVSGAEKQLAAHLAPAGIAGACYFKAGVYIQACSKLGSDGLPNVVCAKKGWAEARYDAPEAYAEVLIRQIDLN